MKADVFHKWFVEWEARTRTTNKEGGSETRLMVYDDYLSRVNYVKEKENPNRKKRLNAV